jgi:hypothetical protein
MLEIKKILELILELLMEGTLICQPVRIPNLFDFINIALI